MTWEEHCARAHPPWSGRTSVRGLEFGSYAFALGKKNVEMGTLRNSSFEWPTTRGEKHNFFISLQTATGATIFPSPIGPRRDSQWMKEDARMSVRMAYE